MDILQVVKELYVDLNLRCICQRTFSNEVMLCGGGVAQDHLVKGALDLVQFGHFRPGFRKGHQKSKISLECVEIMRPVKSLYKVSHILD